MVGLTGMRVNVNCPPVVGVTGSAGSVTETVYVSGVPGLPVFTTPRSASSRRRRAPLEGGVAVVELGIGKITLTWPLLESNVFVPPFWSVSVIFDAEEIFGASR